MAAARAQAARTAARPHPPKPAGEKHQAPDAAPGTAAPAAPGATPLPAVPVDGPRDAAAADAGAAAPGDGAGADPAQEQAAVLLEIERERAAFDAAFARRTELTRELNLLFELAFEQRKRDDELTRAGIKLI